MSNPTQVIPESATYNGTSREIQTRIWDKQQPGLITFMLVSKSVKAEVERLLNIRDASPDGMGDTFLPVDGDQKFYFDPFFDTFYIDLELILSLLFFFLDGVRTNSFDELGDIPPRDRLWNSSEFDIVQNLSIPHLQPDLLRSVTVYWVTGRGAIFPFLSPTNGITIVPLLKDREHKSVFAIIRGLEAELTALRDSIPFGGEPENQEVWNAYTNAITRVESHVRGLFDVN
ncbi:hypothetical protein BDZ45DRAFT_740986 [Acephala macrosclerotiorum]|nr:hypothetical protein BDZ45DRAFT_740986 [Acephala macrosclerotiorum]